MSYLDFDIEIGPGSGREYPVVVVQSAGGEAHEVMHFPFDELSLESRLKDLQIALLRSGGKRRQIHSQEELTVRNFGRNYSGQGLSPIASLAHLNTAIACCFKPIQTCRGRHKKLWPPTSIP